MGPQTPDAGEAPGEPSPLVRLRQLGPQWAGASGGAFAGMAQSPERYAAASRLVAAWLDRLRAAAPGESAAPGEPGAPVAGAAGAEAGLESDEDHDEGAQAAAAALLDAWDGR